MLRRAGVFGCVAALLLISAMVCLLFTWEELAYDLTAGVTGTLVYILLFFLAVGLWLMQTKPTRKNLIPSMLKAIMLGGAIQTVWFALFLPISHSIFEISKMQLTVPSFIGATITILSTFAYILRMRFTRKEGKNVHKTVQ